MQCCVFFIIYLDVKSNFIVTFPVSVLEVYQFAHDASVCEVWLSQNQGMVHGDPSSETERSIDETEQMLRKLDGFEKAAVPWENRFGALEKVTAVRAQSI